MTSLRASWKESIKKSLVRPAIVAQRPLEHRLCRGGACSALRTKRGVCPKIAAFPQRKSKRSGRARPLQAETAPELEPTGEERARLDDGGITLRPGGDHADFD